MRLEFENRSVGCLQLIRISSIGMMTVSVLLVAFLGLLLQDQASAELLEENCGVGSETDSLRPKIFDGEDATVGSNPWMALLSTPGKDGQPPSFYCAGTLITECFVLTAAHCVINKENIIVRLGEFDRSSKNQTGKEDIYVIEAHMYKEYIQKTQENDIALLRLSRCVSYNVHIRPICIQLNSRRKTHMDNTIREFTAVGWGKTRSQDTSNVLQTVTLDRLPKSRCDRSFWNNDTSTQICAGSHSNGPDTCGGDSGGPLYTTGRYEGVRRHTQLGIISYGTKLCQGVGVYTNVMSYVEWIEKIVLESDIVVVVPKIDFLDTNCISSSTTKSRTSTFPWLAHVYIDSFPLALGTLISDSVVLSTAQAYPAGAPLNVVLGRNSGHTEVIHRVQSVHKHPNFERFSENDIALLMLAVKVQYTDHIRPICMPLLGETTAFRERAVKAEHLEVMGFGQQSLAFVQRLNSTNCYNGNYQKIGEKQICFQHPQSTILASGSPLVRRFSHGLAQAYTLVGMASFGRSDLRGPDVYTDVLSYSKWIDDSMGLTRIRSYPNFSAYPRRYRPPKLWPQVKTETRGGTPSFNMVSSFGGRIDAPRYQ